MGLSKEMLAWFLVNAKRHAYAFPGPIAPQASPLAGARQIEWAEGSLLYRHTFFGTGRLVGHEIVSERGEPLWGMSYAGGMVAQTEVDADETRVHAFVRSALQAVSRDRPYRGPAGFRDGPLGYTNDVHGDIEQFWGVEIVTVGRHAVYQLRYSGGAID
jgi:hypothetical protein